MQYTADLFWAHKMSPVEHAQYIVFPQEVIYYEKNTCTFRINTLVWNEG